MKFTIKNDILIKHLQKINRLLTKNVALPILENILLTINDNVLSLVATNIEIEIASNITLTTEHIAGKITVSGRKLLDICRHTPKNSDINIILKNNKMHINSDNSNYILTTLSSENFPKKQNFNLISDFTICSKILKTMLEKTEFSIGKQDVRYYLNGMLLSIKEKNFRIVATDGYRLAISNFLLEKDIPSCSVIFPRKAVIELLRLLNTPQQMIHIFIGSNNLRIYIKKTIFTTQLMEGKYPNYESVLLKKITNPIILNCEELKKSLSRVSILSHEKFCGIEININNGRFKVSSKNQEEEMATDTFLVDYFKDEIEISINVYYILDILNVISSLNILLFFNHIQSSVQIMAQNDSSITYVVMLLKR